MRVWQYLFALLFACSTLSRFPCFAAVGVGGFLGVNLNRGPVLPLTMHLFQEGTAPATTRSRAKTFTQLRGYFRLCAFHVLANLADRNVKAQADVVVVFH